MLDFIRKLSSFLCLEVVEAALSIIPIQGLEGQVIFKVSAVAENQFRPYNGVIQWCGKRGCENNSKLK